MLGFSAALVSIHAELKSYLRSTVSAFSCNACYQWRHQSKRIWITGLNAGTARLGGIRQSFDNLLKCRFYVEPS